MPYKLTGVMALGGSTVRKSTNAVTEIVSWTVTNAGKLQRRLHDGAVKMIEVARAHKLKTMIGCMVSSSVTITAAAQISPLVDYADLDGNLLIANDP